MLFLLVASQYIFDWTMMILYGVSNVGVAALAQLFLRVCNRDLRKNRTRYPKVQCSFEHKEQASKALFWFLYRGWWVPKVDYCFVNMQSSPIKEKSQKTWKAVLVFSKPDERCRIKSWFQWSHWGLCLFWERQGFHLFTVKLIYIFEYSYEKKEKK